MKKYILIIAVLFCTSAFSAKSQRVDSVQHAVQVKPLVFNAINKDTIFQAKVERMWSGLHDTTITTYIIFYDRKARKVGEENVVLPYSFLQSWTQKVQAENYILTFLGLQKR